MLVVFGAFLLIIGASCQGPPDGGGTDFGLMFESPIYVCPDEASLSYIDASKVEALRFNETTAVMTGSIIFLKDFTKCTMIEIIVSKKANGRTEVVMTHEICDVCGEMSNAESNYAGYLSYLGFPKECPFEAGEYPVHDLMADMSELPINSANAGQYEATINMYEACDCNGDKVLKACMSIDCVIEPI